MSTHRLETVGVADAKRRFSELIDRVRNGERFIVTRRGKPVVALVPSSSSGTELPEQRPAGLLALAGLVEDWDHEGFVEEIYAARRRARDRPAPELGGD
jgi:prevent-host-death family protein